MSDLRRRRTSHGSYHPSLPHAAERRAVGDTSGLLRRRFPVGAAPQDHLRAVVEAILYVLRAGCPWRMLPSDFPPWQTVYGYFRRWRDN
ncbi:MAG: hypothetical protein BRC57_03405, partial [Cyanobacteria bacterium QS_8_48_54]